MAFQVARIFEGLLAIGKRTRERSLACVRSQVYVEVVLARRRVRAALERALEARNVLEGVGVLRVRFEVDLQELQLREGAQAVFLRASELRVVARTVVVIVVYVLPKVLLLLTVNEGRGFVVGSRLLVMDLLVLPEGT